MTQLRKVAEKAFENARNLERVAARRKPAGTERRALQKEASAAVAAGFIARDVVSMLRISLSGAGNMTVRSKAAELSYWLLVQAPPGSQSALGELRVALQALAEHRTKGEKGMCHAGYHVTVWAARALAQRAPLGKFA